jgi:release factor glutamine methyltransferase
MTLGHALKAGADFLARKGTDDPRIAAEWLAARLLRCPRLALTTRISEPLPDRLVEALRRGLVRVGAGEPVQYVIGQWDFMGHTLKVDRRALIPRPETEQLVERTLACEALWKRPTPVIADVGTGSGCIVLSLALARTTGRFIGTDISEEAIALARENAEALGLAQRVVLVAGEMSDLVDPETLDALVSNPPYIRTSDYESLPKHIREHEPRQALDGGTDGLSVIEAIIADATIVLKPGGFILLEIGHDQGRAVSGLLSTNGFLDTSISPDLAGRDRIVSARFPG